MGLSRADYNLSVSATETPSLTGLGDDPDFIHAISLVGKLTSATTVPATKVYSALVALSGGSVTIDLTSLTDLKGGALTFVGLKLQILAFHNPSTNANSITVTFGAVNGYDFLGSATSECVLSPGAGIFMFGNDTLDDVGASDLAIDLSGTGSQALNTFLVAG